MNLGRLLLITIGCVIVSVAGVFALLVMNAPAESPGYGKAIVILWPILAFVVFGLVWPVILWGAFFQQKIRGTASPAPTGINYPLLLGIATLLFGYSIYRIYPVAADVFRKRHLLAVATSSPLDASMAASLADDYLRVSLNGVRDGGYREAAFVALLKNPTTPPSVLEKIGLTLNSDSYLWYTLARHPALPRKVIDARITDPLVAVQLGQNPRLSPDDLRKIAESPDFNQRVVASRNVSTPRDCLEKLALDKNSTIRDFARQNLAGTLGAFAYR